MQDCIPKRIIQTGKTSDLQLLEKAGARNLTLLNPDFEYQFFDDQKVEDFINEQFPEYSEIFTSFRFKIQRYDFFRYLAIYHYGGFYFDLDVFLATDLSNLLNATCVFPFECLTLSRYLRNHHRIDWQIGNYAFGAAAGHPFLKAVIDNCVKSQRDPGWAQPMMVGIPFLCRSDYEVLNTTGPGLLTRTLAENAAGEIVVLFPTDVCDDRLWFRFGDFGVHLMSGSWRGKRSRILQWAATRWEAWSMRRLVDESRKLGSTRSSPPSVTLRYVNSDGDHAYPLNSGAF